ncbi:hypothetical protein [Anabaenopsis elenkinii]|uniref:hypothetical protein n=1 Tax=Anabaenopsis elenkinii TaxID=156213 RepID=UPI001CEC10C9|nr:hypothetical protein [Anabaenopsis elenkinii]
MIIFTHTTGISCPLLMEDSSVSYQGTGTGDREALLQADRLQQSGFKIEEE